MSIQFKTTNPQKLLATFKKLIDDDHVITWSYDEDGDFTHTHTQWAKKAWLKPHIKDGYLLFTILGPTNTTISSEVYAIYHGRFIESLLAHCDTLFTSAVASALPADGDKIES